MPFTICYCLIAIRLTNEQFTAILIMTTGFIHHFRATRWFYLFICAHVLCWTLIPILVRYNLPLDAIEGSIWGHQLEWGYDKNPFLNGWLTAFALYLGGSSGWMIYLFSQLSVAICFWCVWQLGRNILPEVYALISVLLLECIQYFNFHAIDFNDNTLELSLWALTSYCFYLALKNEKYKTLSWILAGLFAGFAMMAKYYTAALLAAMVFFLFKTPENRKQLTTLPPYLGLIAFILIVLPHTIWLFFHDFITIKYMFARTESTPSWFNHIYFPVQFAWQQLEVFLPALGLFALLCIGKKSSETPFSQPMSHHTSASFNRSFLFFIGLGPFLLTILLSLLSGIKLRAGWGMPLQSLWGILLLQTIKPHLTKTKIYGFLTAIFLLMGALLIGYSVSLMHSSDRSSANFPGHEIAAFITQEWHDTYHTKLDYVAGSRWVSGNIQFYSKDHPAVFMEWNKSRSPWINLADLKEKGAVFVWEISRHKTLPTDIQKQFPQLEKFTFLEVPWHRDRNHLPTIQIGMAMLPPSK